MEPKKGNDCSNAVPFILALITTVGFFSSLICLFFRAFPSENQQLINALISTLGTVWVLQMGYFFNSSASSKQKDQTIATMAASPTNTNPTMVSAKTENGNVNVTSPDSTTLKEPINEKTT